MNKAQLRFYTLFFVLAFAAPVALAQQPSLAWEAGTSFPLGGTVTPNGVAYDASGNVYITGEFSATADMDPGSGTYNLVSNGGKDIFVASYTSAGAFRWAKGIGNTYDDAGKAIAVDASGNVYITGNNLGYSMNFDPGATATSTNTVYPYSSSTNDVFVASYTSAGAFRWVKVMGGSGDEYGYGITADASGNVTVFGNFSSASVNFNPGNTSTAANTVALAGNTDMFMASYTNTGTFRWAKGIGSTNAEYAAGIASDASGNIFITGSTTSVAVNFNPSGSAYSTVYGNFDIFLASYDNTGAYRWLKSIGSTSTDEGFGVAVDGSGNVSMTGTYYYGNVNFNPGYGSTSANTPATFGGTYPYDVFVANYSNTGTFRWVKGFGGTGQDYGYGIAADALGNVIATGVSASAGVNYNPGFSSTPNNTFSAYSFSDIFAVSYDVNGNFNWAKDIGSVGGSGKGSGVAAGPGNTVAIAGTFSGTSDFNPGSTAASLTGATTNGFLLQVSSTGAYANAGSLGLYGNSTFGMMGSGITYDATGNSYATGYFNDALVNFGTAAQPLYASSKGSDDLYLVSYDASGTLRWLKAIGGSGSERGTAITIDGSGNVYITGSNSSGAVNFDPGTTATAANTISAPAGSTDIFLASYTSNGTLRWVKEMGGSGYDQGLGIAADGSGNVFITGINNSPSVNFDPGNTSTSSNTVSTAGSYDIFIASYTGTGTFRWVKNIGGSGSEQGNGIATDASGNVYLTGISASASVNFDPGAASTAGNTVSANSGDIVIASYSGTGAFRWVKEIGGSGYEYGNAITTDAGGNVYCTGENASASVNFDPGTTSTSANTVSTSANQDIFMVSYSSVGAFRWVKDIAGSGYEAGKGIASDGSANIYITGNTSGTSANFDPGATSTATNTPPAIGNNDIFIASYSSAGTFRWAKNLGSTGADIGNSIAASPAGAFYLTGQVSTSIANLEPFGSNYIAASPAPGIFTAAYKQCSGSLLPATATTLTQSIASGSNTTTIHDACNYIASLKPTGTVTALSGSVSATVYIESSVPTYNAKAYVARHYSILPATLPNTATANITLFFTQQEFTDYNAANGADPDLPTGPLDATGIAALRVTQQHGSSATGMPGSYTYSGSGPQNVLIDPADANIVWNADAQRWEITFPVTGFSGFFVSGNTGGPLPVRLLSFTASKATNSSNRTDWNTAAEDPGTSFDVTRSGNGTSFERLGTVAGKGNNASYTFFDEQPLSGINYYRLKMTEASGESSYSNIAIVRSGGNAGSVTIAPQPATNTLNISNTDASLMGKTAVIYDMQGREMLRFAMEAISNIDIRGWAAGIYTLRLPLGNAVRLIKQ